MVFRTLPFSRPTSSLPADPWPHHCCALPACLPQARKTFVRGSFHLGRFSILIGAISVLWVAFVTVIFVLPTVYPGAPAIASLLCCCSAACLHVGYSLLWSSSTCGLHE